MSAFSHPHLQQIKLQQQQHKLQQQQHQSDPFRNIASIDGQISAPIAFFNTIDPSDRPNPSFLHVMGLGPGGSSGWEPQRKRLKEQDFFESSQVTSLDFFQAGSVSTGLGLSLDDGRLPAAGASSGGASLSVLSMVDMDIGREMQRMDAEIDRFIRIQSERLRQSILENVQAKQVQSLASLEEKILLKIQEKEAEIQAINKKNMELDELSRQLSLEASTWQQQAKYNENMIAALKYSLQQLYAQGRENKEGCGDSEVDDTALCCSGGGIDFQLLCKENKDIKESMNCKVCGVNEVCMLLLPCQHLCLCKVCEGKLSNCPVCQRSKLIGTEIYM